MLVSSNRVELEAHLTRNEWATKGKADRVIVASSEEEEGMGTQRPLEPPMFIPGPSLSSLGYLLPGTVPIPPSQRSWLRLTGNGKH